MPHQTIRHHLTGEIIYEGKFSCLRACVEAAARDNVCLDFADLSRANLVNAALDGASLQRARFAEANLMGANLSEARLDGADFTNAGLQNACLCFSVLRHARFPGALFGATDIAGADVSHSRYSTFSAFTLNFRDAAALAGCFFDDEDSGLHCPISRPPVVVQGLDYALILMDCHVRIGIWTQAAATLLAYIDSSSSEARPADGIPHVFIRRHRAWLRQMIVAFQLPSENRLLTA